MMPRDLVEVHYEGTFSLRDTLKSGQVFQWEKSVVGEVEGFGGCIGDEAPAFLAQTEDGRIMTSFADVPRVTRYFGLDQSIEKIHESFPLDDVVLQNAIRYCPGIRILRQPAWECLATFITSSLKQVSHIRSISMTLRRRYGRSFECGDRIFNAYPDPEILSEAGEDELRQCGLGYRAKSLHLAALAVANGEVDLGVIEADISLPDARKELMRLHGVGEKIANCTLLFSGARWNAFPIDVWIERILREHYRKRLKGPKLQAWAERYFGPNAGYAQQYLFHFARKTL